MAKSEVLELEPEIVIFRKTISAIGPCQNPFYDIM